MARKTERKLKLERAFKFYNPTFDSGSERRKRIDLARDDPLNLDVDRICPNTNSIRSRSHIHYDHATVVISGYR